MYFDVVQGNIAQQTAHGLVNTTGADCQMECGVSGELRTEANDPILDDVTREQPLEDGDVIVTDTYDLSALDLFHVVPASQDGLATEHSIRAATRSVLEQADERECQFLVLPLLGCGGGGYNLEGGATCICEGTQQFDPMSLADVRVIWHSKSDFEQLLEIVRDVKTSSDWL